MKTLSLFAALLFSSLTFAGSHVGEYAHYDFELDGSLGIWEQKIISHNPGAKEYTIEDKVILGGRTNAETRAEKEEDIITRERVAQILTYCTQIGGEPQNVKIRDVVYKTCKIAANKSPFRVKGLEDFNSGNGHLWIADIPVTGFVALQKDGLTVIIKNYHWNN